MKTAPFVGGDSTRLGERAHAEVRRALAPATDRLDAEQRRALTGLLERMLS